MNLKVYLILPSVFLSVNFYVEARKPITDEGIKNLLLP